MGESSKSSERVKRFEIVREEWESQLAREIGLPGNLGDLLGASYHKFMVQPVCPVVGLSPAMLTWLVIGTVMTVIIQCHSKEFGM